jgi:2-amino-4-hydroxy-6-hydroxymethyldihydropteridine diphosphokinase
MNSFTTVFIGLGSNLNRPAEQIKAALSALAQLPYSQSLQCAPWYSSIAIGPGDQPNYINTVASLETTLTPEALLDELQFIEKQHGRQRNIRWGARTLDLDILLYGNDIVSTERLKIPHPEMALRGFVLRPLADLAPQLRLPKSIALSELLSRCDTSDLCQLTNIDDYKKTSASLPRG